MCADAFFAGPVRPGSVRGARQNIGTRKPPTDGSAEPAGASQGGGAAVTDGYRHRSLSLVAQGLGDRESDPHGYVVGQPGLVAGCPTVVYPSLARLELSDDAIAAHDVVKLQAAPRQ
jgi:hypothetical protein